MTRTVLTTALLATLLLAAPYGASHAGLPLNVLANGDFAAGLSSWGVSGSGSLAGVSVVPDGLGGNAVLVQEVFAGSGWVYQNVDPAATAPAVLLDFQAQIWNLARPMPNGIRVVSQHNPVSGLAEITAGVDFAGGQGTLVVFCNGFTGIGCAPVTFAVPLDGLAHHYQVALVPALGTGVLLIDGVPVATATGSPASVSPPSRILFGDLAYHVRGPAPDVVWDDLYYGAGL